MHPRRPARTLTRRQLLTVGGGVALAPAALLAWWRPWRSLTTPSTSAPTPAPPPPTRTPERIALPTERPRPSAAPPPTSTPAAIATAPTRTAAPSAATTASATAGTLLYLSTSDGQRGIVAVNADGSTRRLLAPGTYDTLAVSANGSRLATIGAIPNGGGLNQLTTLDDNGRTLARFPIERNLNGPPAWSPNGTALLCSVQANDPSSANPRWETWVFGDDGARQIAPPNAADQLLQGWTPDGRIAFLTNADPDQPREWTLWTTSATGTDLKRVISGRFNPLAWDRSGSNLYALTYADPDATSAPLAQLVAIERLTGDVRYLASADALAVNVLNLPREPRTYRFDFVYPSPDGALFALGVARNYTLGSRPPPDEYGATSVIFMRRNSQITGKAPLPPGNQRGPAAWSPDGTRLAIVLAANTESDAQLLVFDTAGTRLSDQPIERAYLGLAPQLAWSRDSQLLSHTTPRILTVSAFDPPRTLFLGPGGTYPAWRP
ncbi:MAG: hypothetical protein U0232_23220 [Thermomicrobiales bacterium]